MALSSLRNRSPSLVSVVIPAYNAEATIDDTLLSIRSQTHRHLEILVVDDGSKDGTKDIVRAHAAVDARVMLIEQVNGGVAKARNHGIDRAKGLYVAPVDADDLCAPDRIEKQLSALERAGPRAALAYTWSARIDQDGRITAADWQPRYEGRVYEAICEQNFIGNGSAALMRLSAVRAVGGYDASLHDRGAQGCEDWALYLSIAEHHEFVLVPEFLTGYRQMTGGLSSNYRRMYRSFREVAEQHLRKNPFLRPHLRDGDHQTLSWLLTLALRDRHLREALRIAVSLGLKSPRNLVRAWRHHRVFGRPNHRRSGGRTLHERVEMLGRKFPIGTIAQRLEREA